MYILGVGAYTSIGPGHHAPASTVLFSRAYLGAVYPLHALDAVKWESGIGTGPLTSGISDVHVGAYRTGNIDNYKFQCQSDMLILKI